MRCSLFFQRIFHIFCNINLLTSQQDTMLKRDCKYYKISKATLIDRKKNKRKNTHNGVWLLFYWHSRTHSDQTPVACSTTCHITVLQHYYTTTTTVRTTVKVICGLYLENNISYPLPTTFLKLQLS